MVPERVAARFWDRVIIREPDECWEWKLSHDRDGYPKLSWRDNYQGFGVAAHRAAYWLVFGDFDLKLQIDHLCRNRGCVNPFHLEPVTARENNLRSNSRSAINARRTHCQRGHELTVANRYNGYRGARVCRRCILIGRQARKAAIA